MPTQLRPNLSWYTNGSTGLALALAAWTLCTNPALADCDSLGVATGQTVTCSTAGGTERMPLITGNNVTDVTLYFEEGSEMISAHGIRFGDNNARNTVYLGDDSFVGWSGINFGENASGNVVRAEDSATISGAIGLGIGFSSGATNNSITLNGANVRGTGSGIQFGDDATGNSVTLNDSARASGSADQASGIAFGNGGVGNLVTLAEGTSVSAADNGAAIKDGDGSLTVVSAGTLFSTGEVVVDLGDGDDSLTLLDGAQIFSLSRTAAVLDGGGGIDTLRLEGSTGLLDINYINFENLFVEAAINDGVWNVTGDLVLTGTANVNQGVLSVNANFTTPAVVVASGGSLGGTGTINSAVTIGGSLAPGNSVGTLNVNGAVNFAAGASFDAEVDRTGMDLLAVAGAPGTVTIDPATTINVIPLDRAEGNAGNIVTATGGIVGSFGTLSRGSNSVAATLVQTANAIRLVTAAPSVFSAQVWAGSEEGFAFLDMVIDEAGTSRANPKRRAWTSALYRNAERSGSEGVQSYDQDIIGAAFGTYIYRNGPVRIGAAFGYTGSEVELGSATGEGDFDSVHGGLYGSYHRGSYFLDGTLTGGYQTGDSERIVIVDGASQRAKGDSDAFLVGSSIHTGWALPMGGGWSARPTVSFSYMHRHQDSYSERGGGDAAVALDSENSDAARMNWQLQVARASTLTLKGKAITLRPSARVGLMYEWTLDDRDITGRFQANGAAFSLHMDARDETMATFGAGIEAGIGDWTAFVAYNGVASKITDRSSVTMGLRKAW